MGARVDGPRPDPVLAKLFSRGVSPAAERASAVGHHLHAGGKRLGDLAERRKRRLQRPVNVTGLVFNRRPDVQEQDLATCDPVHEGFGFVGRESGPVRHELPLDFRHPGVPPRKSLDGYQEVDHRGVVDGPRIGGGAAREPRLLQGVELTSGRIFIELDLCADLVGRPSALHQEIGDFQAPPVGEELGDVTRHPIGRFLEAALALPCQQLHSAPDARASQNRCARFAIHDLGKGIKQNRGW